MITGRAAEFERVFAKLCARLIDDVLDAAAVGTGQVVLDVGSGTGNVAAAAIARGARVTAVEPDEDMLAELRQRVPEAEVWPAVLPRIAITDAQFDAVVANCVLNHVDEPHASVVELRRLLRPGGRLAATVWRYPREAGHDLLWRAAEAAGIAPPKEPVRDADFPRTEAGMAALLREAGIREVSSHSIVFDHRVDPEAWWTSTTSELSSFGRLLRSRPRELRDVVKHHYDRLAVEFTRPDGSLALPHAAVLASGIR